MSTTIIAKRLVAATSAFALSVALAGCSYDAGPTSGSAGGSAAVSPSAGVGAEQNDRKTGFGHVHALDINQSDGTFWAATHHGVFRLGPGGPERTADRQQDTMAFTVSGPDLFLASGHPDQREGGPENLGLITSTDQARTWTSVSLRGQADFHSLTAAGTTVYGYDAIVGVISRSDDNGESWQRSARLAATDVDVDPENPLRLVASTPDGLQESVDGGIGFAPMAPQPPRPLSMIDHVEHVGGDRDPSLVGIDIGGGVWALHESAWRATGQLPDHPAQAFTVVAADRYLAATERGVVSSEDAGRSWTLITPMTG